MPGLKFELDIVEAIGGDVVDRMFVEVDVVVVVVGEEQGRYVLDVAVVVACSCPRIKALCCVVHMDPLWRPGPQGFASVMVRVLLCFPRTER